MTYVNVTFLFLLGITRVVAQELKSDSSFVASARQQAVAAYDQAIYEQAHVYDGHEYITHDHRIKIHPYYRVDSLQTGTVLYNGVPYDRVRMLYDIVRDELAIQPLEGGYRLRLRNEYVAEFTIGPYRFTRITGIPGAASTVPTGFYEVLHDGTVKALVRRIKTVKEDISQGFYKADYQQKDRFFVVKEGTYHELKTKGSLVKLFPQQAKALRKFMRSNRLTFTGTEREATIARLMQYYEKL